MTFAPTCFGSHRNHPQGAVQYLAKNYRYGSTVLVGVDADEHSSFLRFYIIECICWNNEKFLILLMHGATVKTVHLSSTMLVHARKNLSFLINPTTLETTQFYIIDSVVLSFIMLISRSTFYKSESTRSIL
jgi:hypothetical protein